MPADVPAAHSMDTQWFAVDSEGQIGLFESGEPGPVPIEARSDEGAYEWLKHLFFAAPNMLLLNAPAETFVHAHELLAERSGRPTDPYFVDSSLCMILRSKEHLSQIGTGVEVGPELVTAKGVAFSVYVQDVELEAYKSLHESGACLGCIGLWWLGKNCGERLGIFYYDSRSQYRNGPYVRIGAPDKPLLISQLPPEVRSLIAALPLPIRFERGSQMFNRWSLSRAALGAVTSISLRT